MPKIALRTLLSIIFPCLLILLFPAVSRASELPRDILIKGPGKGAAVYYLALDDKRYVFPNQQTYLTWFRDFSDVYEVTVGELAGFPLGGNVTYRPGVRMVKITTDPKVYAVDRDACLRWVTSEEVAIQLYGSDWNRKIDDVPDAFFFDYKICDPVYSTLYYQPIAAAQATNSINLLKSLAVSHDARVADTIPDIGDAVPRPCTPSEDITKSGLSVALADDGLPNESFMLLGGESDVVLGSYRFRADNEDMKINGLAVNVSPAGAVSGLRLYDGDSPITGSVTVGSGGRAVFEGFELYMSKGQSKRLVIKGDIRQFGQGISSAGQEIRLTLDSSYFRAESALSCSDTYISGGVVLGERLPLQARSRFVRRVRPRVSLVPLADTAIGNGRMYILGFGLSAGPDGDLAFRRITLSVTGEFHEPVTLRLSESGNLHRRTDGSAVAGTYRLSGNCASVRSVNCTLAVTLDKWETVLAGQTVNFTVSTELEGALTSGDSMSVRMDGDMDSIPAGEHPEFSAYNFVWSDTPYMNGGSVAVEGWANGAHIFGLPTAIQVLNR